MQPPSMTQIESAARIVERRCAMTMVVHCLVDRRLWSAPCTIRSLSPSSALVASSSSSSRGERARARAMARRCFWPPESRMCRAKPMSVLY
mmetsp:Transcript_9798/g.27418  ORF Transcript_9798/g.27418 Transcript_9798/m.27418 type:complete len:91 (-) Transcript_9798:901-1173(-)